MDNQASAKLASLMSEMRLMEDGAEVADVLLAALIDELGMKARQIADGPWEIPAISTLRIRRNDTLSAWTAQGNVCLAGENAGEPVIGSGLVGTPASDGLLILGRKAKLGRLDMMSNGALTIVGDDALLGFSAIGVSGASVVMIGERTISTLAARLDAKNGGGILVGPDGLWAHEVRMMTDDMHAIRDLQSGKRLNHFGGRIVVERHVWFGQRVEVLGNCRIGADTVVGIGALVKSQKLPPNAVYAGRPARPVRTGTTWTLEDVP